MSRTGATISERLPHRKRISDGRQLEAPRNVSGASATVKAFALCLKTALIRAWQGWQWVKSIHPAVLYKLYLLSTAVTAKAMAVSGTGNGPID